MLGSALFVVLPEALADFKTYAGVMVALVLLLVLLWQPQGIIGAMSVVDRLRTARRAP